MPECRDIHSNPAERASHVAILHQELRRTICHKTSSNFLLSLRLCFSTFPQFMDFFTTRAPNVSEREGGLEGYWLTIILKRFTWGRKAAASRAVKCEQLGLFPPMFDTQIRGKFMEIWVKNRRHHHILRLISDSSVSWRFRGRGRVFLGFGVSSRES